MRQSVYLPTAKTTHKEETEHEEEDLKKRKTRRRGKIFSRYENKEGKNETSERHQKAKKRR